MSEPIVECQDCSAVGEATEFTNGCPHCKSSQIEPAKIPESETEKQEFERGIITAERIPLPQFS